MGVTRKATARRVASVVRGVTARGFPVHMARLGARDGRPGVSMDPGLTVPTWHSRVVSAKCIFSTHRG
ncbi:hypothetical protein RHCRD62_40308 [Rhodococcus sp. RD6.2]|nr:hypothetical protein RHCRD62_40308 [Rhodococcus sp. RD6.2]